MEILDQLNQSLQSRIQFLEEINEKYSSILLFQKECCKEMKEFSNQSKENPNIEKLLTQIDAMLSLSIKYDPQFSLSSFITDQNVFYAEADVLSHINKQQSLPSSSIYDFLKWNEVCSAHNTYYSPQSKFETDQSIQNLIIDFKVWIHKIFGKEYTTKNNENNQIIVLSAFHSIFNSLFELIREVRFQFGGTLQSRLSRLPPTQWDSKDRKELLEIWIRSRRLQEIYEKLLSLLPFLLMESIESCPTSGVEDETKEESPNKRGPKSIQKIEESEWRREVRFQIDSLHLCTPLHAPLPPPPPPPLSPQTTSSFTFMTTPSTPQSFSSPLWVREAERRVEALSLVVGQRVCSLAERRVGREMVGRTLITEMKKCHEMEKKLRLNRVDMSGTQRERERGNGKRGGEGEGKVRWRESLRAFRELSSCLLHKNSKSIMEGKRGGRGMRREDPSLPPPPTSSSLVHFNQNCFFFDDNIKCQLGGKN